MVTTSETALIASNETAASRICSATPCVMATITFAVISGATTWIATRMACVTTPRTNHHLWGLVYFQTNRKRSPLVLSSRKE